MTLSTLPPDYVLPPSRPDNFIGRLPTEFVNEIRPDDFTRRDVGFSFPVAPRRGGLFAAFYTRSLIRASISMILNTRRGERVMLPEFGSDLPKLVFEPSDVVLETMALKYTSDAIALWEPRVTVLNVVTRRADHSVQIGVVYRINTTSTLDGIGLVFRR